MEEFRNICMKVYDLDPIHSYIYPGLAWQAMLKETKCTLDLIRDIDMVLMVESGITAGFTQSVTRYVKASSSYFPTYDATKEFI